MSVRYSCPLDPCLGLSLRLRVQVQNLGSRFTNITPAPALARRSTSLTAAAAKLRPPPPPPTASSAAPKGSNTRHRPRAIPTRHALDVTILKLRPDTLGDAPATAPLAAPLAASAGARACGRLTSRRRNLLRRSSQLTGTSAHEHQVGFLYGVRAVACDRGAAQVTAGCIMSARGIIPDECQRAYFPCEIGCHMCHRILRSLEFRCLPAQSCIRLCVTNSQVLYHTPVAFWHLHASHSCFLRPQQAAAANPSSSSFPQPCLIRVKLLIFFALLPTLVVDLMRGWRVVAGKEREKEGAPSRNCRSGNRSLCTLDIGITYTNARTHTHTHCIIYRSNTHCVKADLCF